MVMKVFPTQDSQMKSGWKSGYECRGKGWPGRADLAMTEQAVGLASVLHSQSKEVHHDPRSSPTGFINPTDWKSMSLHANTLSQVSAWGQRMCGGQHHKEWQAGESGLGVTPGKEPGQQEENDGFTQDSRP